MQYLQREYKMLKLVLTEMNIISHSFGSHVNF